MKVSVIIPIYNTAEYLRPCIRSICSQTYRDLEIIMVDDGSEKETADICDELALEDPRIRIVHKINEGVSKARNTALELATGEIVCFVDSDDTIHPEMISDLVQAIWRDNAEIAMCDAVTLTPGKPDEPDTIPDFSTSCVVEMKSLHPSTLTRLAGSVWRCAYRRSLLIKTKALFPEGLKFSEDRIFNLIAMSGASRMTYLKKAYYNRLIREGSACNRYYPDMTTQIVKMRTELLRVVRNAWGERFVEAYERQILSHIHAAITNYSSSEAKGKLNNIRELCENSSIRDCVNYVNSDDIRSRMILRKNAPVLLLLGSLTNIYHRLWKNH